MDDHEWGAQFTTIGCRRQLRSSFSEGGGGGRDLSLSPSPYLSARQPTNQPASHCGRLGQCLEILRINTFVNLLAKHTRSFPFVVARSKLTSPKIKMFKLVSLGSVLLLVSLAPCGLSFKPSDQVISYCTMNGNISE